MTGEVLKPDGYIDHRRTLPAPPSPPHQHQEEPTEGGHETESALEAEAVGELSESDRSRQVFLQVKKKKCTICQCCGSGMFILDPNFFHPGSRIFPSRIRVKEFKYF